MKFVRHPGDPQALERFLGELRILARLDHPNIVRVLASDFLRADPYFTMEYLAHGSLSQVVKTDGPLPPAKAVRLVRVIADALGAAHAKQVIHRDLKPSNILLTPDGTPKVADFGLAKHLDEVDPITRASGTLGTPNYMPPEQVSRKNGAIGPWSDVYGLGATLYHLLTGRAPFVGDTSAEIVYQVLADPPTRPRALYPEIPLALEGIVVKCLEKDPKDRYQTIAELAADLDNYEQKRKTLALPLTRARRARRWIARNRLVLTGVGCAVLLAMGLVWVGITLAPVPKVPLPEPAVEPSQTIRNELATERRAVLLGESGRPRHTRWLVGTASLIEPTDADPAFAFEAPQPTLLELLANPGTDRYSVTAAVRLRYPKAVVGKDGKVSVVGAGDATLIGICFGCESLRTARGDPVHVCLAAGYSDYLSADTRKQFPKTRATVQLRTVAIVTSANGSSQGSKASAGKPIYFDLADDLPAPWRRIRVEVTPGGAKAFWAESETAEWQPLGELSAEEIARRLNRKAEGLGAELAAHSPLVWNPSASVGIWCDQAAVSVRNVIVETLP
jgi:hypothetical protein